MTIRGDWREANTASNNTKTVLSSSSAAVTIRSTVLVSNARRAAEIRSNCRISAFPSPPHQDVSDKAALLRIGMHDDHPRASRRCLLEIHHGEFACCHDGLFAFQVTHDARQFYIVTRAQLPHRCALLIAHGLGTAMQTSGYLRNRETIAGQACDDRFLLG